MKLFHMHGACSLADLIVLQWVGAPHETITMDAESVRSSGYLALNAGGTVPMLLDDGFSLTENVAILGYLADLHPGAGLLGNGSLRERAETMRWLAFLNSDVHKAFNPIFTPGRFLPETAFVEELAANARVHVREYLERLDAQLEGRDWLTGARSIADPYLFVVWRWAVGKDVELDGLHNLLRFVDRMNADAGVQQALATEKHAPAFATASP